VAGYYTSDGVIDDWDELDVSDYIAVKSSDSGAACNHIRYNKATW
jgi:hypothetical protein